MKRRAFLTGLFATLTAVLHDPAAAARRTSRRGSTGTKRRRGTFCGAIKRLRPVPGGGVQILSDNPNVPTATAYEGELHILGRVVATVRKM